MEPPQGGPDTQPKGSVGHELQLLEMADHLYMQCPEFDPLIFETGSGSAAHTDLELGVCLPHLASECWD